jgi:hypothetical protein
MTLNWDSSTSYLGIALSTNWNIFRLNGEMYFFFLVHRRRGNHYQKLAHATTMIR